MRAIGMLLAAALLVAGCGTTRTSAVVTGDAEAAHGRTIRILMDSAEVPEGFREIALVQARGTNSHADMPHVVEGARRLGCTIIVRVRIDQGKNQASGTGVCGVLPP